jgi:hypothetical protein
VVLLKVEILQPAKTVRDDLLANGVHTTGLHVEVEDFCVGSHRDCAIGGRERRGVVRGDKEVIAIDRGPELLGDKEELEFFDGALVE